jgi:hypothetical protein
MNSTDTPMPMMISMQKKRHRHPPINIFGEDEFDSKQEKTDIAKERA